jgi:hypothetical protein
LVALRIIIFSPHHQLSCHDYYTMRYFIHFFSCSASFKKKKEGGRSRDLLSDKMEGASGPSSSSSPSFQALLLPVEFSPPPPTTSNTNSTSTSFRGDRSPGAQRCPYCHSQVAVQHLERHLKASCRVLACHKCDRVVLRADLHRHISEYCPERIVACSRCQAFLPLSAHAEHSRRDCIHAPRTCQSCGEVYPLKDMREHLSDSCTAIEMPCEHCGESIARGKMVEHESNVCRTWQCGCGARMPTLDRVRHLSQCSEYLDAWEGAMEKVLASGPKAGTLRNMVKLEQRLRVSSNIALLALAEAGGDWRAAEGKIVSIPSYLLELQQASELVNVKPFLAALTSSARRRSRWSAARTKMKTAALLSSR